MVVFINGAFGVGKTSVARALRRRLPGSVLFDPEVAGYFLRRLPRWVPLRGRGTGDYQDMPAWRNLAVRGIRAARVGWARVIVPMAFSNPDYLDKIRGAVRRFDADVRHSCLVAPFACVSERLRGRGADPHRNAWEFRRAEECCAAHARPAFAGQVQTEGRDVGAVADELLARLSGVP